AVSPLEHKQSPKAPPILFIQPCDNTINRLVLFGYGAIGVLLTRLTNTLMNIRFTGLPHARSSFCYSDNVYFACQFIRYELFAKSSSYFLTKPKIHAVVEALGNPVRWRLTPGQRHDITQAQALVEGLTTQALTQAVVADKAFDADEFIESIKKTGAQAVIPPRDNRTQARDYDRHLYK